MLELSILKKYIETLKQNSFEGWSDEAMRAYLTACISIEEYIKTLQE